MSFTLASTNNNQILCIQIELSFLDCRYGIKSVTFVFMNIADTVKFVRMNIFMHDIKVESNSNKFCMSLAWK
jgi:hypothetical protein